MLVGSLNPNWDDMSPFVVHFTKATDGHSAYDNSLSILASRRIEARRPFGISAKRPEARNSICFSEIPLHRLKRLADKRGSYGIGFRKDLLVARDGGPILYAYKDTAHALALQQLMAMSAGQPTAPIWQVVPFVDQPGAYPTSDYFFEWEREWRHVGHLKFKETDPVFLIIPESLHQAARSFFDDAEEDNLGPNYKCPFIDPYWNLEKVSAALGGKAGQQPQPA